MCRESEEAWWDSEERRDPKEARPHQYSAGCRNPGDSEVGRCWDSEAYRGPGVSGHLGGSEACNDSEDLGDSESDCCNDVAGSYMEFEGHGEWWGHRDSDGGSVDTAGRWEGDDAYMGLACNRDSGGWEGGG